MTYLLDTHTFIWALTSPKKLSGKVQKLIQDPRHHVVVSAISFWEIALKFGLGKLHLNGIRPEEFPEVCKQTGFSTLSLEAETCASYHLLGAQYHKDPFDRMLIWLALSHQFVMLSNDDMIRLYQSEGLSVVW